MQKKRVMLAALAVPVAVMTAIAANPVKEFESRTSLLAIPEALSYGGQKSFVLGAYNGYMSSSNCSYAVVDENLETIFNVPDRKASFTEKKTVYGPALKMYRYYSSDVQEVVSSPSEALAKVRAVFTGGYVVYNDGDSVWYFEGNTPVPEEFKRYCQSQGTDGKSIEELTDFKCNAYAIYSSYSGVLTFYNFVREYSNGEFDMESGSRDFVYETSEMPYEVSMYEFDYEELFAGKSWECVLTQTAFNDDADYEVLLPSYGEEVIKNSEESWRIEYKDIDGNDSFTWLSCTVTTSRPAIDAIEAVNVKTGSVVTRFVFPEILEYPSAAVFATGERRYLRIEGSKAAEATEIISYFYDLDDKASVKAPVLVRTSTVSPTLVNRGENINVRLEGDDELRAVSVVSATGASEVRRVAAGKSASVSSAGLAPGVHVVGVETFKSRPEYTKVIIR